jgi:Tfp pilus assembly protein PilX
MTTGGPRGPNDTPRQRKGIFYIEEVEEVPDSLAQPTSGPPPTRIYYRVIARGEGGTDDATVVLHSTYVRRY